MILLPFGFVGNHRVVQATALLRDWFGEMGDISYSVEQWLCFKELDEGHSPPQADWLRAHQMLRDPHLGLALGPGEIAADLQLLGSHVCMAVSCFPSGYGHLGI